MRGYVLTLSYMSASKLWRQWLQRPLSKNCVLTTWAYLQRTSFFFIKATSCNKSLGLQPQCIQLFMDQSVPLSTLQVCNYQDIKLFLRLKDAQPRDIRGKNISDLLEAFFLQKKRIFFLLYSFFTKLCNLIIMIPVLFLLGPFFWRITYYRKTLKMILDGMKSNHHVKGKCGKGWS